jgi:hypothetical protein
MDRDPSPDSERRFFDRVNLEMIDLHLRCDVFKLRFEPEITEF